MRYLELFRHTDNEGDSLTSEGVAAAESIGRERLSPPYALFGSTGAHRADQMVEILRRAAGQEDIRVTAVPGLRSSVEERWRAAAKAAGKGATLEQMRSVDADLVEKESALLGGVLRALMESLPEGGRGLLVGHSPTNEAAVLGATGEVVAPQGKGEAVLVVQEDHRFSVRRMPDTGSP